tara:strand:+ start:165 stop:512 length:348 start_codon:yes stop_codon:yes gene_type:complete
MGRHGLVKMMPNINPRQMQKMMNKMGMKQDEIPASEVIIKSEGKEIIIKNPQVMKIDMMGQESFQISGEVIEGVSISKEDIQTVAEQGGVSEEEAKKAIEENNGDLAEAIINLQK